MFCATFAMAQTKTVTTSTINWWGYKIAKTASSSHTGTIDLKSGNVVLKGKKVVGGNFVLDMNSITSTDLTGDPQTKLNGHLKNGDFFEVEKFPSAKFSITSIKNNSSKAFPYLVLGNLTIKGKTKAISFPAKISSGSIFTLESDKFSFDRQYFDVAYQSSLKDVLVKDDIDMKIVFSAK